MEALFPIVLNQELKPEIAALITSASQYENVTISITDDASNALALETKKQIKGLLKELDAAEKSITKPLNDKKSEVIAYFKTPKTFLENYDKQIEQQAIAYARECEKKRLAEEAAALEKARKEREKLEAQAQKALDSGKVEKAEALQQQSEMVVAQPVQTAAPKVSGISMRTNWSAEVTDLMALVKGVAEGRVPINAIQADMVFLNAQAKALKENFNMMYAGCKAVSSESMATRSTSAFKG